MSNPKLTPWIAGSIKPVRVGVYQRKFVTGDILYSKFDGENWLFEYSTIEEADNAFYFSWHKNLPWRGLAEQPK